MSGQKTFWSPISSEHGTPRAPPTGRQITTSLCKKNSAVFQDKKLT